MVPVHPELQTALTAATSFGTVGQGRLDRCVASNGLEVGAASGSSGPLRLAKFLRAGALGPIH